MNHHYKTLVGADIYRDGGSLEAKFILSDGRFETVFLEISRDWLDRTEPVHGRLLVYSDLDRECLPVIVTKASALEEGIMSSLKTFIDSPSVNVPFGHKTADEIFLNYVHSLIEAVPNRIKPAQQDAAGQSATAE